MDGLNHQSGITEQERQYLWVRVRKVFPVLYVLRLGCGFGIWWLLVIETVVVFGVGLDFRLPPRFAGMTGGLRGWVGILGWCLGYALRMRVAANRDIVINCSGWVFGDVLSRSGCPPPRE